jgi:TetR/AcrR family transcriptional repressor of nem operon
MRTDTRQLLLQTAETLIRTRGYAAFSYADLAARAAITKASVHYYFPTKEALVAVLVAEYVERFTTTLETIRREHASADSRLRAYARLFLDGFEQGLLPLCGALSAERAALPGTMHPKISDFFQLQLDWLRRVIDEGLGTGRIRAGLVPDQAAMLLLSTLEGGSFVGWALQRKAPVLAAFEAALHSMLDIPATPRKARSRITAT